MTTPDNVTQKATMPSREFLVRQAVLNAINVQFPAVVKVYSVPVTLRLLGLNRAPLLMTRRLEKQIYHEFHALVSRFTVPSHFLPTTGIK